MTAGAQQGRAAQRSGKDAEKAVERTFKRYRRDGLAEMKKRPTPWRIVRRGSRLLAFPAEPAGVDYTGALAGGRAVFFEVKASSGASLPLERRAGKRLLNQLQTSELHSAHRLGALAGLLVRVRRRQDGRPVELWFWVSLPGWVFAESSAREAGRASVGLDLLREYGVECETRLGSPLWLEAVQGADFAELARRYDGLTGVDHEAQ